MKLYELLNMTIGRYNIILKQDDKVLYNECKEDITRHTIRFIYGKDDIKDIDFILLKDILEIIIE